MIGKFRPGEIRRNFQKENVSSSTTNGIFIPRIDLSTGPSFGESEILHAITPCLRLTLYTYTEDHQQISLKLRCVRVSPFALTFTDFFGKIYRSVANFSSPFPWPAVHCYAKMWESILLIYRERCGKMLSSHRYFLPSQMFFHQDYVGA